MIKHQKKELSVILQEINDQVSRKKRAIELRRLCALLPALAKIVQYTYHPDFILELPEGPIPNELWEPSMHDEYGVLYRVINKGMLNNVLKKKNIPAKKKETVFLNTLSMVTPGDTKVLIGIKDKKLPYNKLTEDFCKKHLPELFPNE